MSRKNILKPWRHRYFKYRVFENNLALGGVSATKKMYLQKEVLSTLFVYICQHKILVDQRGRLISNASVTQKTL